MIGKEGVYLLKDDESLLDYLLDKDGGYRPVWLEYEYEEGYDYEPLDDFF